MQSRELWEHSSWQAWQLQLALQRSEGLSRATATVVGLGICCVPSSSELQERAGEMEAIC